MFFLISILVIAIGALSVKFFLLLSAQTKQIQQLKKVIEHYQLEQSALVNADLVFARQLQEINRQISSVDSQLQMLENKRENDGGYQHAFRILEMGGDKAEIMSSCHLSSAEAELLMNLNAYRAAISKA